MGSLGLGGDHCICYKVLEGVSKEAPSYTPSQRSKGYHEVKTLIHMNLL